MIEDFSFEQVMRLSNVKRWGIIEMSRQQTVAEHSFNVAIISDAICQRAELSPTIVSNVLSWALAHDLPEVVTGDVPSPLKHYAPETFKNLEAEMFPYWRDLEIGIEKERYDLIPKVADYIDAIQFAQKFCVDKRKDSIVSEMIVRYRLAVEKMSLHYDNWKMVDPSWLDLRTL